MRVGKAVLLTVAAMAATSVAVWTATGPAQGSQARNTADPRTDIEPASKAVPVDKSSFTTGGTLMMEGRLGHAVLPAGSDTETFVSVSVTADASKRAATPSKLNLAIVIDRSGSMKGNRLSNALEAAQTAINKLRDGDVVSVLAYNTGNEVVVPATELTADNRAGIAKKLRSIRAKGDTCISCGISGGMRLIGSNPAGVSRVLLLSDGLPTAGVRDVPGFQRIAENCRRMGVSVTTIGVDIDYNEAIMAAIARESNGRHFFVQDPTSLARIFDDEMELLSKTVASNAKVSVELTDGVFVDKIFDRAFERNGNTVVVPLGAFAAADKKSLLMRLRVPRGPAGERPIAAVRLEYADLADDKQASCDGELIARVSADPNETTEIDGLVQARVSRSETTSALNEANDLFAAGDSGRARDVIRRRKSDLAREKQDASRHAPAKRKTDVDKDFAFQGESLAGADDGFDAEATPTQGRVQSKVNAAEAVELAK